MKNTKICKVFFKNSQKISVHEGKKVGKIYPKIREWRHILDNLHHLGKKYSYVRFKIKKKKYAKFSLK